MKKTTILLLILLSNLAFAQRKLPYPIVLVHGWSAKAETWDDFTTYLSTQAELSICPKPLKFNLNFDNDVSKSIIPNDIANEDLSNLGNHDVYLIDFKWNATETSNQGAATKQGYALNLAINEIIKQSKCQRVMILGHSMGGLAARELVQNPVYENIEDKVAKIVTIGTPHQGSNFASLDINLMKSLGKDIRSEAVRDLRTSYTNDKSGVYLFGGIENTQQIQLGTSSYYNVDVNCNGLVGETITGLNQRGLKTIIDYACIIGKSSGNGDGIVSEISQNLKLLYPTATIETFDFDCSKKGTSLYCHTAEPQMAFTEMLQGLDETKIALAPMIVGEPMSGFFTKQSNGNLTDTDDFNIFVPSKGYLNINANFANGVNAIVKLKNCNAPFTFESPSVNLNNNNNTSIEVPGAGCYTVSISGNSLGSWSKYNINTSVSQTAQVAIPCSVPSSVTITSSNNNFCIGTRGGFSTLTAPAGFDSYRWKKDEQYIENATNSEILVAESGNYKVEVAKCNSLIISNNIIIVAYSKPEAPKITTEVLPDKYVLRTNSTTFNQWQYIDLKSTSIIPIDIQGETKASFEVKNEGVYTLRTGPNGCTSSASAITIKVEKPNIKAGKTDICEGDSTIIQADQNFSRYSWIIGKDTLSTTNSRYVVKKNQSVSFIAYRGNMKSPKSDSVAVKVNPLPSVPTLSITDVGIISSVVNGNQWYENNVALPNETNQILKKYGGSNSYYVVVGEGACTSKSSVLAITATELESITRIKVYPNPTTDYITVDLPTQDTYVLRVIDTNGKVLIEKQSSDQKQIKIDLSDLHSALYFVNLSSKKHIFNAKIARQ